MMSGLKLDFDHGTFEIVDFSNEGKEEVKKELRMNDDRLQEISN